MKLIKAMVGLFLLTLSLFGCQKLDENTGLEPNAELTFRYIEEFCCGNLMIVNENTIDDFSGTRSDSLTYGVNLEEYIISENLKFGDELIIGYELLATPLSEEYEINCISICNRFNGLPIKILSLKK